MMKTGLAGTRASSAHPLKIQMNTPRTIALGDGTVQVRRISWLEFYRLRPDLKPDNDNEWRGTAIVGATNGRTADAGERR